MASGFRLGDIAVEVVRKDIKNLHLGVYPPAGSVRIAAPLGMSENAIRVLAISKLSWIRAQRRAFQGQARDAKHTYVTGESHPVWGKRYLLRVEEGAGAAEIVVKHSRLLLRIRPGASVDRREALMDAWYRKLVNEAVVPLLAKWTSVLRVRPAHVGARRMRTKWGSCNAKAGRILLNSDLAKKPRDCLEYVLVHELVHLRAPTHDDGFVALMNRHLPHWRQLRRELNRLSVRHEDWCC
jgi:predicted metal-dependent hydrolase